MLSLFSQEKSLRYLFVFFFCLWMTGTSFSWDNFYVSPGVSSGYTSQKDYYLGGEVSVFYMIPLRGPQGRKMEIPPFIFTGFAAEGLYHFADQSGKWIIGPELGIMLHDYPTVLIGIDGGYLKDGKETGYAVRPFVSFPFFPFLFFYYRYNHLEHFSYNEFGAMIKIPLAIFR